jgi:hypothetical protein
MELITTYEVTPEMQKASIQAYYFHGTNKRKWIIILGFLVLGFLICQFHQAQDDLYIGIGLSTVGGVLLLVWVKSYFTSLKSADDTLKLDDDNTVTVTFTEEHIKIERLSSKRQTQWKKITHIIEAGDFIILQAGKLPIASLPKKHLSEEQITFIKSHAKKQKKSNKKNAV